MVWKKKMYSNGSIISLIVLLTVRWYLRYNLSFRDVVEMLEEQGLSISHTTIMRWVHQYGPEFDVTLNKQVNPEGKMKQL